MPPVFALSIHADYRCGHSGACCTAGWPIPVERGTHARLIALIERGTLTLPTAADRASSPFAAIPSAPPETPVVAAADDRGACVFYERDTGLCAIHRQAGEALLPVACRQFPRVALRDGRGLFVSLSHYCPTAVRMLFRDDAPLDVVPDPPAFPRDFHYDPLDALDAFPPLLRPGVLMDLESFDAWERRVVATFASSQWTPEEALARVAAFTEYVRGWKPGESELRRRIEEGEAWAGEKWSGCPPAGCERFEADVVLRDYALVLDAIPAAFRHRLPAMDVLAGWYDRFVAGRWPLVGAPIARYLAARAFGSWLSYQGRGLRTIVFSLGVALSLLRAHAAMAAGQAGRDLDRALLVAAIRRTDELLLHLASRELLAGGFSFIEEVAGGLSSGVR